MKLNVEITFKGMGILKDQYEMVQTMIYGKWYKHLKEAKEKGDIDNFLMFQPDNMITLEIYAKEERLLQWKKNFDKLNKRFSPVGKMFKLIKINFKTKLENTENNFQEQ